MVAQIRELTGRLRGAPGAGTIVAQASHARIAIATPLPIDASGAASILAAVAVRAPADMPASSSGPHGTAQAPPPRPRHKPNTPVGIAVGVASLPDAPRAADASAFTPDMAFLDKLIPWFQRIRDYTRLKVFGLENVPAKGPALIVANHTGWLGLDYALTALSIYESTGRLVRGMAHEAWFRNKGPAEFARKCGILPVSKNAIQELLAGGDLVIMFPEGERGAFRPGSDYTLEPFARGFVRIGMQTHVPIIPVAILGGEESNPVGRRIESYDALLNLRGGLPIPKNLWPKPVKWRIRVLSPLLLDEYGPDDASDHDLVHSIAEATRARIQREVRILKAERGHPYF